MKPNSNEMFGGQRGKQFQGQGPNWILIAGGALLSTLSVRLGYRLKQVLDSKQPQNATNVLKENGKHAGRKRTGNCRSHSLNLYCFEQDDGCFNCISGMDGETETKAQHNGQLHTEPEIGFPLVSVSAPVYNKENGVMWASSPDRVELPQKAFNCSNGVIWRFGYYDSYSGVAALMERIPSRWPRPEWHAPWKNYRVISGHLGWVRSIAFVVIAVG